MNGVHDMGGMHGMGPVEAEKDEPVFHGEWEGLVFAMTLATGYLGRWNIDMSRSMREQMPAAEYLATTYYDHWLWALERLLDANGLVQVDETERRMLAPRPGQVPVLSQAGLSPLLAADVEAKLRKAPTAQVDDEVAPRFHPGDRVRARNIHPTGHTRLPRYARGREGTIDRDHGVWVFPDTSAAGQGTRPQHVYSVRFAARELWGAEASARDSVYVDLWDDYLDPA